MRVFSIEGNSNRTDSPRLKEKRLQEKPHQRNLYCNVALYLRFPWHKEKEAAERRSGPFY